MWAQAVEVVNVGQNHSSDTGLQKGMQRVCFCVSTTVFRPLSTPCCAPSSHVASLVMCTSGRVVPLVMATLRKRGFCLSAPGPEKDPKTPKAATLTIMAPSTTSLKIPPSLAGKLRRPDFVIGFDIETHDWEQVPRHVPYVGQFGWEYNRADTALDFSRVVQLGWAICPVDMSTPVTVKTELIQPAGFVISERASKYHSITQEHAIHNGRPIDQVLAEFIADVAEVIARGGRICAHQLETDGG